MSTIQEFEAAAAKATQASAQADTWANGPINTTVPTDSGPVPTIAEFTRANQERADDAIESLGWVLAGDFTAGCTVTERNQYVLEVGGSTYRWDGSLPKVVPPGGAPSPEAPGSWVRVLFVSDTPPLPDVWAPLSDSLRMITGYGRDVLVGSDVVARMVNFTRASTATYIDKSGVLRTAAINEPRFEKDGLLIEGQSTNLITTSAVLATSSVTVAAGSYTLSFYGTGSVTLSGAATGVLTGTAADKRVSLTVTTTAGVLTLTVAGTCSNAQLEALPFATSYIPTSGAAATRASDRCSIPQCGNLPDVSGSDYFIALTCKLYPQADIPYRFLFRTGDIPGVSAGMSFGSSVSNTSMRMYTGLASKGFVTQPIKYGQQTTYGSGLNNKRVVSLGPAGVNRSSVDFTPVEHSKDDFLNGNLGIGGNYQGNYLYGHIRNFRIWHSALTDDQLKAIK